MKRWAQLQHELYRETLAQARLPVAGKSKSLQKYEQRFLKDQRDLKPSTLLRLFKAINASPIVLVGDFHTLRQSQRFFLRLLRDKRLKKPKRIGLEILRKNHLPFLNSYLKDRSHASELRLKKALQLESHWGSHFETYRELFDFAHDAGIEIVPLGSTKSGLRDRDRSMAKVVGSFDDRLWILVGEFHCARAHLPKEILSCAPDKEILVIGQNSDSIYLKHQESQGDLTRRDTVYEIPESKKTPGIKVFCSLHTPLWIKYQSLFEHYMEGEEREGGEIADARAQIVWSLETLDRFLRDPRYDLKEIQKALKNLHVFRSDTTGFYRVLSRFEFKIRRELMRQMKTSGVAVSFRENCVFLSETTINACSQAAGLYLYQAWSSLRIEELSRLDQLLMEAIAFFLSKLLNHSRKPPRPAAALFRTLSSKAGQSGFSKRIFEKLDHNAGVYLSRELGDLTFEAFLAEEFARSRLLRILQSHPTREQRSLMYLGELFSLASSFRRRERGL